MEISEIATPDLVSETALRDQRIEVRFVGSAEPATLGDLTTYLESVHRAALDSGATEVSFDLRSLEFVSAACLRSLLHFMTALQRSPRYVARFVSDTRKPWQRRSLEGLASFVGGALVRLE